MLFALPLPSSFSRAIRCALLCAAAFGAATAGALPAGLDFDDLAAGSNTDAAVLDGVEIRGGLVLGPDELSALGLAAEDLPTSGAQGLLNGIEPALVFDLAETASGLSIDIAILGTFAGDPVGALLVAYGAGVEVARSHLGAGALRGTLRVEATSGFERAVLYPRLPCALIACDGAAEISDVFLDLTGSVFADTLRLTDVPEPAPLALLAGVGLALLALRRRALLRGACAAALSLALLACYPDGEILSPRHGAELTGAQSVPVLLQGVPPAPATFEVTLIAGVGTPTPVIHDVTAAFSVSGSRATATLDDTTLAPGTNTLLLSLDWNVDGRPDTLSSSTFDWRPEQPGHTVARRWNDALLDAIRIDTPRPTVHGRNLFHLSAAMYDAWLAWADDGAPWLADERRISTDPLPADVEAARSEAISHAAYHILRNRFATSPGAVTSLGHFDDLMDELGYDRTDLTVTGRDPAAIGNRIAQAYLNFGLGDGSNELQSYEQNVGYAPVNDPMIVKLRGTEMFDPNRWQALSLDFFVLQNGIIIGAATQEFLGPHWGNVTPFALDRDRDGMPYLDPGLPPQLGGDGDEAFKLANVEVVQFSSGLDPDDGVWINASPGRLGNRPLGTHDDQGWATNPHTGLPYPSNWVRRGDRARVLAEFWADGPDSETPPGHWNTVANYVSDHALLEKRIGGTGPVVDDLEWDVKLYFALNGAVHDAAIAAWESKWYYDYTRPVSSIRYMSGKGQSSDPNLPSFDPEGMLLVPGLVELITPETAAEGGRHHHLGEFFGPVVTDPHIGEIAIRAWPGEPEDTENDYSGVEWILGEDWVPYQRATFVTPNFAGYVSGHSTFSRAAAEVLTGFTGSPYFPGGVGEFVAERDEFLEFEIGPIDTVILEWATYQDAADESGISRLWGGIHVRADDFEGRIMGYTIGNRAWDLAQQYYDGSIEAP